MYPTKLLFILVVAISAIGCQQQADLGPLRDVPYYTGNPDERATTIARCEADPGQLDTHSNCVNARASLWNQTMDAGATKTTEKGVPRIPDDFHEKN